MTAAARTQGRPMVRATAGVRVSAPRPELAVVPRRRRAARLVAVAAVFVASAMLATAAFQTQLASRQLTLDQLDKDMRTARTRYDDLRRQRAELRSPGRLTAEATALGMVPASKSDFLVLTPDVLAAVQQSAGGVLDPSLDTQQSVFEEFTTVKSLTRDAP
jgi:hypothetical protein